MVKYIVTETVVRFCCCPESSMGKLFVKPNVLPNSWFYSTRALEIYCTVHKNHKNRVAGWTFYLFSLVPVINFFFLYVTQQNALWEFSRFYQMFLILLYITIPRWSQSRTSIWNWSYIDINTYMYVSHFAG